LAQICTKSFVGWGFAPDPTGVGELIQRSPRPPSWIKGPTSKGGEERKGRGGRERNARGPTSKGRGGEEREGRGKDGKGGGIGEGRKGMAGPIPNPLLRVCVTCDISQVT